MVQKDAKGYCFMTKVGMLIAEDSYASMEKDQLISMIHFLVKREDERAQENQDLKDMVKELRDTVIMREILGTTFTSKIKALFASLCKK